MRGLLQSNGNLRGRPDLEPTRENQVRLPRLSGLPFDRSVLSTVPINVASWFAFDHCGTQTFQLALVFWPPVRSFRFSDRRSGVRQKMPGPPIPDALLRLESSAQIVNTQAEARI